MRALALDNDSVERDAVAGADLHDISNGGRTGRDLPDSAVLVKKNSLRAEIDGFHDLAAALLDCAVLERFTDAVEEHNADRLAKFTGSRTHRSLQRSSRSFRP